MSDDLRQDKQLFSEIRNHAQDLQRDFSARNLEFEEYERMFLLKWKEDIQKKLLRRYKMIVQSPDPRDKVLGAMRLMIGTDPIFRLSTIEPRDNFDPDKLEEWLKSWWTQCDRISRRPILHDMILSGMLYGQMDVGVSPMSDLVKQAPDNRKERVQRRMKLSPVLIETWNPKDGYPEFDEFGLSAYYRQTRISYPALKSRFGERVPDTLRTTSRFTTFKLHTFYDLDYCCIWVDGLTEPLVLEEHGYPEIPISVTMTDGSTLFDKPEDQIQPLLFGMRRANIWEEQNLMTTTLFNMIFALGANPAFKHVAPPNNPAKKLKLDFSLFGETVELESGEDFTTVLNRNLIPPEFVEMYQLAIQKGHDTTIYPQALGAPVNRNTTFSEISLLAQQGRLPLISAQRQSQLGIANVIELALMVLGKRKIKFNGEDLEIPPDLQIDVTVEVKMPQDKLQLANIANILRAQELVDDEWIHTNILNITNSKQIQRNIWKQNASKALFVSWLQQMLAEQQRAPMPPNLSGPVAGSPKPPDQDALSAGPSMPPGQGEMIQGGLPPQMAGMMPGMGEEVVPPDEEA